MTIRRREVIVSGALGAGATLLGGRRAQGQLVFPDSLTPSIAAEPSPRATPWVARFNRMPWARPVRPSSLRPRPDPARHQRYEEFPPRRFYVEHIHEFLWQYHPEPPYAGGSWSWGFNGMTPGPTYRARYGEPILVRRFNDLPPLGAGNARFALPSLTIHLHNAHTASESDGIPTDYFEVGEYYDYHYANFPAGFDDREKMTTLWYHDHRLDFTAPNVYAGLSGIYLFFDEQDSGNERDPRPGAFRLPSGPYDVPMILHDVQFDKNGQVVWDFLDPMPQEQEVAGLPGGTYSVNGMIGDQITINRIIKPYLDVEPRKYRFRIVNGGPSRFYELYLRAESAQRTQPPRFFVVSTDGNLLPEPIETDCLRLSVAQRHDVVVDFSHFAPGDDVYLVNRLVMRDDGAGPSGRLDEGEDILRCKVGRLRRRDPSRIPDQLRALPPIDLSEVRRERVWDLDYDNGLWTINGKLFDPKRIDARVEQGSAEIWTFRSKGNSWSHPMHIHFEEFQILERNYKPIPDGDVQKSRKDDIWVGPNDQFRVFMRFRDFYGRYVMHCHNVVHEDNAMMVRWDVVPPGQGD